MSDLIWILAGAGLLAIVLLVVLIPRARGASPTVAGFAPPPIDPFAQVHAFAGQITMAQAQLGHYTAGLNAAVERAKVAGAPSIPSPASAPKEG